MSVFSVCIPRIFHNIPNKKIVGIFETLQLGKVKNMDIIWKTGRDGSSYKMAFIHFSEWNMSNASARRFREQVEDPNVIAKLVYDDPWHWLVLPNNSSSIINSYKNRVEKFIPDNANGVVSQWMKERLSKLEDELNCVYEELYQREYIPIKYRTECEWDQDIETGNINDDYVRNISPMTVDELNCSVITSGDMSDDNSSYIDELHKQPKYTKVYPEVHSLCSSELYDELYYNRMDYYNNTHVLNNSELSLNKDNKWMTVNYCGNN